MLRLLVLLPLFLTINEIDQIRQCRKLFFQVAQNDAGLNELFEHLEAAPEENYLIMAYKGVVATMAAENAKGVSNKFKLFLQGKAILEKTIKEHPDDIEPRFLRLTVQENAPFFLGYNGDKEADKDHIIAGLEKAKKTKQDNFFISKVVSFLKTLDFCTEADIRRLNKI